MQYDIVSISLRFQVALLLASAWTRTIKSKRAQNDVCVTQTSATSPGNDWQWLARIKVEYSPLYYR
jgi:hypothetical protein